MHHLNSGSIGEMFPSVDSMAVLLRSHYTPSGLGRGLSIIPSALIPIAIGRFRVWDRLRVVLSWEETTDVDIEG